jgi:hypothetical protein
MKISHGFLIRRLLRLGLLALAFGIFALPAARARTITLSLEFARQQYSTLDPFFQGQTYYTVFVLVSSDIPPVTYDEVDSPAPDVAFGGSETGNGYTSYGDLASALNEATNGVWTLTVNKGDASEKQYTFKVSASGLDPSNFPTVQILTPGDGNEAVSTNVQFSWSGPASWDELDLADHTLDNSFYTAESPSPDTTTWNDAPLALGTNEFEVTYKTNAAAWITISTPLDSLSHPFTNWVSGSKLDDFVQSGFVTGTNAGGNDFDIALNTTNLTWNTSGDTDWFTENTYTYDGIEAAQSGSVTNNQSSTLSVTVTGPGTVTFYWSSIANDPNQDFDFEFYIDDPNNGDDGDLFGDNSWQQAGPFIVQPGQHTLNWTVYADGDTDPTQAGFLDQVSFVPDTSPVITENPFNQTNHSGYNVALLAAATSPIAITWQWFEVGNPSPLPNATNALFIPANSGTAGVAGSYYAVASTSGGSAITTTALVSFVSAPLPPNWSVAMKSPFAGVDPSAVTEDFYGGCTVDSTGNVYVADQYIGNVDVLTNGFVENILTAAGINGGAALVKHDASGNPLWAVGLTNNQPGSYSFADCVALAPENGAYLASIVVGTNWLGTNKFVDVAGSSLLISRFDANGSNIWSRFIGGTNGISIFYNCLASDAAGNVTVAGTASGTFSLGSTSLTAPPSGQAGFLAQYDANGTLRWAEVFPEWVTDVTYGGGIIYVSVWSGFGAGPIVTNSIGGLSVATDRQWAIASLNATNGQGFWLHGLGAPYGSHLGVIDDVPLLSLSGSDVFVTGTAYGTGAQFGGLAVSVTGGRGQYFARYDTNGNAQVATSFGSPTTATWASAANASGVYVTGDFDYYSQFGGDFIAAPVYAQNDLGPSYFTQPFVAKFDRNGNPLWAQNGVSSDEANFRGIAVAADGVWASGFFQVNDTNSVPARFGTNTLFSDRQSLFAGAGGSTSLLWYPGGVLAKITETTATATPVTLLNPQTSGANFQFQFLSQSGFMHSILYRTNLALGNWQTNSTVAGDGTVKTISLPFSLFSPAKQGFIRVSTQ